MTANIAQCSGCGQTVLPSDSNWTIRGFLCPDCLKGQYGGRTRSEAVRLFEPAPEQLEGQTTMEGMDA